MYYIFCIKVHILQILHYMLFKNFKQKKKNIYVNKRIEISVVDDNSNANCVEHKILSNKSAQLPLFSLHKLNLRSSKWPASLDLITCCLLCVGSRGNMWVCPNMTLASEWDIRP